MKPRVFVGASREHLELARAVQDNLDPDAEVTVWDQDVFALGEYPLDALAEQLQQSDFGVFVMAPSDLAVIRGTEQPVPRDNVVFEVGLFAGHLGRTRTFVIVPRGARDLHLPTDLLGLTIGEYDANRVDENLVRAVAPVCNKIRRKIREETPTALRQRAGIVRVGLFPDFYGEFNELISTSRKIVLYFIHSRRWRENHHDTILQFLSRSDASLTVILPDLKNVSLMTALVGHFDDGRHIPGFVADAYRYFATLMDQHAGKVRVFLSQTYPTYSLYKFDGVAIVAMYPTTPIRRSVPAFYARLDGTFGEFVDKDLEVLMSDANQLSIADLRKLACEDSPSVPG